MRGFSLCSMACATLLAACTPWLTFTKQDGFGFCLERAPGCDFDVITSRPARQYQTIGMIDIDAANVKTLPNDEASFRRAIAAEVCRVGGDAVIPGVNGDHRYVLATVVRWVDDDRKTPICPKPPKKKPGKDASDAGHPDAGHSAPDAGTPAAPSLDAGADASAAATRVRAPLGSQPWARWSVEPARGVRASQGGAPC